MAEYDDFEQEQSTEGDLVETFAGVDHLLDSTEHAHVRNQALCRIHYLANTYRGAKMVEEEGCKPYHDSIMCWPATPVNTTLSLACPPQIQGISYMTEYSVTRRCGEDGTWERANYSGCVPMSHEADSPIPWIHLRIMYCMYWIGYILSLVFLIMALAIFARYRKLWCLRNIIHSNLILCFALHNVTWIVYSLVANEILTKVYGLEEMSYCYIPTILLKYFIAAGFFWMFVEGVYLFISVIYSFHTRRIRFWMCAIVGWGVPLLLVLITTLVRSQSEEAAHCWNEQYHLDYIFIGPVLCILMVNVAFLLIIMYVVVTKLQVTVPVEATRYKKAIKALFILCPLLGVSYVFVLVQPSNPMWAKLIFSYYFTIMTSFQGFLVALLFCFRNNEVCITITKSLRKWRRLKFPSQSTLRESGRSDTPTMMMEFDISSPGKSSRQCIYTQSRTSRPSEQQTTKLRNVVVMNDDGEFRLFLPQSYLGASSRGSSPNTKEAWGKQIRKVSSLSWTSGRQMTVDTRPKMGLRPPMVRCATSDAG